MKKTLLVQIISSDQPFLNNKERWQQYLSVKIISENRVIKITLFEDYIFKLIELRIKEVLEIDVYLRTVFEKNSSIASRYHNVTGLRVPIKNSAICVNSSNF